MTSIAVPAVIEIPNVPSPVMFVIVKVRVFPVPLTCTDPFVDLVGWEIWASPFFHNIGPPDVGCKPKWPAA